MVKLCMLIQSLSGALPGNGVRRVNEEVGIRAMGILLNDRHTVAFDKAEAMAYRINVEDAPFQRFRIPARVNALAVFALLQRRCAGRKNAAAKGAVLENGLQSTFAN